MATITFKIPDKKLVEELVQCGLKKAAAHRLVRKPKFIRALSVEAQIYYEESMNGPGGDEYLHDLAQDFTNYTDWQD